MQAGTANALFRVLFHVVSIHMFRPCRYVLSNIETRQGLARGDRVWQIAFGSGFKCNSAVWRALRSTNEQHKAWVGVKVSDSDV